MGASEVRGTEHFKTRTTHQNHQDLFFNRTQETNKCRKCGCRCKCVRACVCVNKRKDYVDQTHRKNLYCLYSLAKKPMDI